MFTYELRTLLACVREGRSAHVCGPGGVGATTLLTELRTTLEAEGFTLLVITGTPYMRDRDFFALQQSLVTLPASRAPVSYAGLVDAASAALLGAAQRAVIIDSIENVDRSTLSVIQAAADRTGAPVVLSRAWSIGALVRNGVRYTRDPGRRVDLRPLDFVATAALLQDQLGGRPDTEIVSRIFAKSHGITGLALATLDGARDNGLIELRGDRWVMTGQNLRNPHTDAWLETRLAGLDPASFDGLEHLAVVHSRPQPEACTRVDEQTVKDLEGRGLISMITTSAGHSIALNPPALKDFFLDTSGHAFAGLQGDSEAASFTPGVLAPASVALSVRGFREHVDQRLLELAAAWEQTPTVRTALPYVQTLLDVPRSERTLRTVFDVTPLASAATPEEGFDFAFLHSLWAGRSRRGDARSSEIFHELVTLFPVWARSLEIFSRLLTHGADSIGDDPTQVFSDVGIVGTAGEALCISTFAYASLIEGRFAVAAEWVSRVPDSGLQIVRRFVGFVEALTELVGGEAQRALDRSLARFQEAQDARDHAGILLHAYVASLSLLGLARWDEALDVVDSALSYGPSGTVNNGLYRSLLWMGSFINLWLGDTSIAAFFEAEAESLDVSDDALPGMQGDLGGILRLLIQDAPTRAMEAMRGFAERLKGERRLFAALMTVRIGLAIWPDISSLELFRSYMIEAYGQDPEKLFALGVASFSDPERLVTMAREFGDDRTVPLALLLLAARSRQERESTSSELGVAIRVAFDALKADADIPLTAAVSRTAGADDGADALSARETEIALLARTHSNAAIASRLGLSVRTIENHIHSALKKTGATNRQELFQLISR